MSAYKYEQIANQLRDAAKNIEAAERHLKQIEYLYRRISAIESECQGHIQLKVGNETFELTDLVRRGGYFGDVDHTSKKPRTDKIFDALRAYIYPMTTAAKAKVEKLKADAAEILRSSQQ